MKIFCPHCRAEHLIREGQLGQKVECQHCSHSFTAHTPNGEDTPPCASREKGDEIFDTAYCYGAPRHSASLVIIANKCQHLFFLVLGSCLLCWIIVAATTDKDLILGTPSVRLPVLLVDVSTPAFYIAAPLILVALYVYLLAYLAKLRQSLPLSDEFSNLPICILPAFGSLRLDTVILLLLCFALQFFLVPGTIIYFWIRYLPTHSILVTLLHIVLIMLSTFIGLCYCRIIIREVLVRIQHKPKARIFPVLRLSTRNRVVIAALAFILLGVSSFTGMLSPPSSDYMFTVPETLLQDIREFFLMGLQFISFDASANLRDAVLSEKPAGVRLVNEEDFQLVGGAHLPEKNLRNTDATGAFLAAANLIEASLCSAQLDGADLRYATLGTINQTEYRSRILRLSTTSNHDLRLMPMAEQDNQIEGYYYWSTGHTQKPYKSTLKYFLRSATLRFASLRGARLQHSTLIGVDLGHARLIAAKLNEADMRLANLSGADLRWADMTGALLKKANLIGADLRFV